MNRPYGAYWNCAVESGYYAINTGYHHLSGPALIIYLSNLIR